MAKIIVNRKPGSAANHSANDITSPVCSLGVAAGQPFRRLTFDTRQFFDEVGRTFSTRRMISPSPGRTRHCAYSPLQRPCAPLKRTALVGIDIAFFNHN
jgi:hypothetical protein